MLISKKSHISMTDLFKETKLVCICKAYLLKYIDYFLSIKIQFK